MPIVDVEKKIIEIIVLLRSFLEEKRVGNIQVNMYMGGISNVNRFETLIFSSDKEMLDKLPKFKAK